MGKTERALPSGLMKALETLPEGLAWLRPAIEFAGREDPELALMSESDMNPFLLCGRQRYGALPAKEAKRVSREEFKTYEAWAKKLDQHNEDFAGAWVVLGYVTEVGSFTAAEFEEEVIDLESVYTNPLPWTVECAEGWTALAECDVLVLKRRGVEGIIAAANRFMMFQRFGFRGFSVARIQKNEDKHNEANRVRRGVTKDELWTAVDLYEAAGWTGIRAQHAYPPGGGVHMVEYWLRSERERNGGLLRVDLDATGKKPLSEERIAEFEGMLATLRAL